MKWAAKVIYMLLVFIILSVMLAIYAMIANDVETSRVEAAILRDCKVDLEVSVDEIGEPGVVMKNYDNNGTSMRLICQGAAQWSCTCNS